MQWLKHSLCTLLPPKMSSSNAQAPLKFVSHNPPEDASPGVAEPDRSLGIQVSVHKELAIPVLLLIIVCYIELNWTRC